MTSPRSRSHLNTILGPISGCLLAFLFVIAVSQMVFAGGKEYVQAAVSPREAVEQFCRAEFNGHNERYDNARITSAYKGKKRRQGYDFDGGVNLWDWNPYIIVTSYEVLSASARGERGTASVAYRRIGRSDGKEKIIPETSRREVVTLNLTFDGTRWWVLDPPLPRVSKEELLTFYEKTMERFPGDWLQRPDITEHQKTYFLRKQEALKVLKEMPSE
jgi:hypothetical protein